VLIRPDTYFENTLNILQHLTREELNRLGSPVNKSAWDAAPAVVNAYYSRNKNQISKYIPFLFSFSETYSNNPAYSNYLFIQKTKN
jgi:hypothetical protein